MKPEMPDQRKPRGRPKGPRPGGRPSALLNLKPGERCFFEASIGKGSRLMQQIGADVSRNDLSGKIEQRLLLAVEPSSRELIELVMVTRLKEDEE